MPDLTASPVVTDALRRHFGFEALRPGQARALAPVLDGRDALVVMPTGAGKSLVYQLAAVVDYERGRGTTVVVSPLIALMKDQVDALRARGIPAAAVHSGMSQTEQREVLDALARGLLALVYVAPERLRQRGFLRALGNATVARLAVDEAHCVSQWGHDFRPDYRTIAPAREGMGHPPCVALTATATREVQADIADSLRLGTSRDGAEAGGPEVVVTGFDRPNLVFEVRSTTGRQQKRRALAEILANHTEGAGLLYVSTRKDAEDLARFVRETTGQPCEAYHAGLPDRERTFVQDRFIGGELDLVVATNAFGMGVDRPDVRFVAHWSMPSTLEAYYQEAGRAGRDGRDARAVLFYAPQDRQLREWFIEQQAPEQADLNKLHRALARRADENGVARGEVDEVSEAADVHPVLGRVALTLLERAGLAVRLDDEGSVRVWRVQAWEGGRVRDGLRQSHTHRDHKTEQLKGVVEYAEADHCRRRVLLAHFGDAAEPTVEGDACCDACAVHARLGDAPAEVPPWDAIPMHSRIALGLLDAVTRLRWPVGRTTMVKVLAGSRAKGMEKYESHPYFGRLQTLGQEEVDALYKSLLLQGYLRMVSREANGSQFQVLDLTPLGKQALAHREAIQVGSDGLTDKLTRAAGSSRDTPEAEMAGDAADRFERLRAWRTETAQDSGVPPYVVFDDKTLRALAETVPETEAELLAVKGIGPTKAERYGEAVLALLAA